MNNEESQFRSQADRITARRDRIEACRIAKNKISEGQNVTVEKSLEQLNQVLQRESYLQIQKGLQKIEETKVSNEESVTNVELDVYKRELKRRSEEQEKSDLLNEVISEAQTKADSLLVALNGRWENISSIQNPYDLAKALLNQKESCKEVVDIKSKVISNYMGELKLKDDEYVKEFKRQSDETDLLMSKMNTQYKSFQTVLNDELSKIELAFVHEREELLNTGKKDTEILMEKRRLNEKNYTDSKWLAMSSNQDDLETLRAIDAEDYNKLKIKLETDIQILEQQLAQMRGTYQLNMEKLEYNYQVLKKREEENSVILAAQKRRVTKLTDNLKILKTKSSKQEKNHELEEQSLEQELTRMKELYEELHRKYRNFQLQDEMKFQDLKKMQEDTVRETIRKLLLADKIIHEEHLKEEWIAPDSSALRKLSGIKESDNNESRIQSTTKSFETLSVRNQKEPSELIKFAKQMRDEGGMMKKVFDMICIEAGFLIDEKLQDLLQHLPVDEQSLMKIDSIFRAFNIKSISEIKLLANSFILVDEKGEESLIDIDDAMGVLTAFMESRQTRSTSDDKVHDSIDSAAVNNDDQIVDGFWKALEDIIDGERIDKWEKAYEDMQAYYAILLDKGKTIEEIKRIENQNEELELLLSKYKNSKASQDLCLPPIVKLVGDSN